MGVFTEDADFGDSSPTRLMAEQGFNVPAAAHHAQN
jgi:hypothetical protein